ncbi:MAG: fibrobacter succinogenes major paralogous domain-containing protein [Chitinispirillales bacterium]|jgi:uncharacterized protein (TIGR02145 family)|nr:fibrobacter succinogenes major paralogous domain-containing protein [Chitinispirillales bacterium]
MRGFIGIGWALAVAAVVLLAVGLAGCGSGNMVDNDGGNNTGVVDPNTVVRGTFTDDRDGTVYKTVKIGTQTWMAENLNYAVDSSWCYDNDPDNCVMYGRLYSWAAAMDLDRRFNDSTWGGNSVKHKGVCPTGWHLSSRDDWDQLSESVGGTKDNIGSFINWLDAGKKLKSTSGWVSTSTRNGNGTDDYGFSALPGGMRDIGGAVDFTRGGAEGTWWTSMNFSRAQAYHRNIGYSNDHVTEAGRKKYEERSVRCVQNFE